LLVGLSVLVSTPLVLLTACGLAGWTFLIIPRE
jgi:hypothetical protein